MDLSKNQVCSEADGNGRMGRLWQTLILAKWNSIFAWIPMETVLYQNRPQYYQAIEHARKANDSGAFIEFTLSAIADIITAQEKHQEKRQEKRQEKHQVDFSDIQLSVLNVLRNNILSRKEIFSAIGLNGDSRSFKRNIEPLIAQKLIEMTVPEKPNSRLQKYRLTEDGKAVFGDVSQ